MGPVPYEGEDKHFPANSNGQHAQVHDSLAEKCPNRRGIEMILESLGGKQPKARGRSSPTAGKGRLRRSLDRRWLPDRVGDQGDREGRRDKIDP